MLISDRDHVKELNNARPKQPFFFLKPSSSILPPNSGPVLKPRGVKLHYEVELALIMGKQVRDLDENDEKGAMNAIDGGLGSIEGGLVNRVADGSRLLFEYRHDSTQCPG